MKCFPLLFMVPFVHTVVLIFRVMYNLYGTILHVKVRLIIMTKVTMVALYKYINILMISAFLMRDMCENEYVMV